jgi:ParB family chromosome partitioning protein
MGTTLEIQAVDPSTLLVDVNVRTDLRLNPEFVGSVKQHGVLVPIVAVKTADGLRVRMGHRRTAAAIEAGRDSVPVVITDTEAEGDAAEIDRLLTQHAENHHRAGFSVAEDANVAKQLSLMGVKVADIAKRTNTKKADVETALKVTASELAFKATERYDLTLAQAAVLAEFEDDTETVTALVAAVKTGQFDHVAQRARNDRAEAEAKAPVIAALTEAGVEVVGQPSWSSPAKVLSELVTKDGQDITAEDHASCDGHAAYLVETHTYVEPDGTELPTNRWGHVEFDDDISEEEADRRFAAATMVSTWSPIYVCTGWKANGHRDRYDRGSDKPKAADKTDAERDADKKARALVIENNKAWKAARQVRSEWVKTFLTRKTPPANIGGFLAVALTRDADLVADVKGNTIAADWFGVASPGYGRSADLIKAAGAASDKRAHVIALGTVLAGYEARATDSAWRENGDHSSTGRYLRLLKTLGYVLSDVETYAASNKTA